MLDIVSEQYKSDVEYHSMLDIVSEQFKSDVRSTNYTKLTNIQ